VQPGGKQRRGRARTAVRHQPDSGVVALQQAPRIGRRSRRTRAKAVAPPRPQDGVLTAPAAIAPVMAMLGDRRENRPGNEKSVSRTRILARRRAVLFADQQLHAGMFNRPSGIVALLTDFGGSDPYVGLMKGMLLREHPRAVIVDLLHDVPSQDVALGGFFLRAARGRFPPGTIFVAIVDPGVGNQRGALCAYGHGCFWLGPDNGVLGEVLDADSDVRMVDLEHLGLVAHSRTFHGRDMFAPLAGALAAGRYGFSSIGPRVHKPARVPSLIAGAHRIVHVDNHGNLVTNVPAVAIASVRAVRVAGRSVPLRGNYADAAPGDLVSLVNSYDLVEVAENEGSAAATLAVGRGATIGLET